MLFNSYEFIFLFLPVTLAGAWGLQRYGRGAWVREWLLAASLFFYGWWNPAFLPVIVCSIGMNLLFARWMGRAHGDRTRRLRFAVGCAANLAALAYFKYANFFAENLAHLLGSRTARMEIELPLAISFFTFQQIAFLADAVQRRELTRVPARTFALFVAFFPQLIAGPIVHHKEMTPQLEALRARRLQATNIASGLTLFLLGLFKKTVLADTLSIPANEVFDTAATQSVGGFYAWTGTLAYTLQLYFDFSGYCDMAMGAALMLGIRLPINFDSPYKAKSIIDFWRRWHITLSHFLRDYLYIPLGGNRRGRARRHLNLMITMVLGGLWHGAGWTFVLWGALHGAYLVLNHAWQKVRSPTLEGSALYRTASGALTFACVMVAWVYFRAESLAAANRMLRDMFTPSSFGLPVRQAKLLPFIPDAWVDTSASSVTSVGNWMLVLLVLLTSACFLAPNTHDIMGLRPRASVQGHRIWRPRPAWAIAMAFVALWAVAATGQHREFLYFQF